MIERVTFVSPAPTADGHARGGEGVEVITLRHGENGDVAEDSDLRGLHPMIAERMDLWRLSNFTLERIPADHEVHLFRAVARDNDATSGWWHGRGARPDRGPRRAGANHGAARARADRAPGVRVRQSVPVASRSRERLHWNRVMLYVWPVMESSPTRLDR